MNKDQGTENLCTSDSSGGPARYVPPHLRGSNNFEGEKDYRNSGNFGGGRDNREYRNDRNDYRNDNRGG